MPISNFRYLLGLLIILTILPVAGTPLLGQSTSAAQAPISRNVFDQTTQQDVSERLKAIYQRGAFRGSPFEGTWHDGSSYWGPGDSVADDAPLMTPQLFAAATGEPLDPESANASSAQKTNDKNRLLSPDGKWRLQQRNGELSAKEVDSNKTIDFLQQQTDRKIHLRNLQWSPDSKHVLFVQTDSTDVRERSVLVPTDPTYPGTASSKFPRVGGKISQRKVGVAT